MDKKRRIFFVTLAFSIILILLLYHLINKSLAERKFYVSPLGNDNNSGLSKLNPWKTLSKVNNFTFEPGDKIFFKRGGEWRESLFINKSGESAKPIIFDAYGRGKNPTFYGSELLNNSDFIKLSDSVYKIKETRTVNSVLMNHTFLLGGTPASEINSTSSVKSNNYSWYWDGQYIYLNPGVHNPLSENISYSICLRDNAVYLNQVKNIIIRNINVDETAKYNWGYGFMVESSENITLEDCAAYRAGKHNFGVIDTTGFIGRRLYSAHTMPAQGPGGSTAYVFYSKLRENTLSEWIDCVAESMNPHGVGFYAHGEGIGYIKIKNFTARGCGIYFYNGFLDGAYIHAEYGFDPFLSLGHNAIVEDIKIIGSKGEIRIYDPSNITLKNIQILGPRKNWHNLSTLETGKGERVLRLNNLPHNSSCHIESLGKEELFLRYPNFSDLIDCTPLNSH